MSYDRILIEIDDRDRSEVDRPWSARVMEWSDLPEDFPRVSESGTTVAEALRALADEIESEQAYHECMKEAAS